MVMCDYPLAVAFCDNHGEARWPGSIVFFRPSDYEGRLRTGPPSPNSIATNQSAIAALFRVMNRYLGNLPPMLRASRAERRRRARARPDALGHATTTAHRRSFPSAISCFMAGIT